MKTVKLNNGEWKTTDKAGNKYYGDSFQDSQLKALAIVFGGGSNA